MWTSSDLSPIETDLMQGEMTHWSVSMEWRGDLPAPALPLTCSFQTTRGGGEDITFCTLPHNTCPFQRRLPGASADDAAVCSEPHCIPTDWQVVVLQPSPAASGS